MIMKIDHVALAVIDLDEAIEHYRSSWGLSYETREVISEQGVEEATFLLGDSRIQLVSPLGPDTIVGRFIASRGEGLHHIAYEVEDIDQALDDLKSKGVKLIDEAPRPGGGGSRIAFVHPKANRGLLVELVERPARA